MGSDETQDNNIVELLTSEPDIGPYHLIERIGRGGTGEVWLADQRQPVRRRVAIKLIKAGMDTSEVVARFESERQTLAVMDHPVIAKVFDAGSTPLGRPYFVMEYVHGISITEYCYKHALTIHQRLELFIEVCAGVQYAHHEAIIHRDLKPSNILVAEIDGKPAPRIIDFGIAKAISTSLTGDTVFTRVGGIVGTPGYMSPEQADPAGEGIDTRTDVYSLGVVLYELLTGSKPVELSKVPLLHVARTIHEHEVTCPSSRNRAREITPDLDAITLKALEFDRKRRYATPAELAADLGHYLRHEPVVARPTSALYRARKYFRRHRIGVTIFTVTIVVVLAFALMQSVELRRTRRERERADRITQFMTDMFKVSNPSEARGNAVTAREILDKASQDISVGLAEDPELQAQLMFIMGTVYHDLGLYPQALGLESGALAIQRRVLGSLHPDTLRSIHSVGWTLQQEGHLPEAAQFLEEALAGKRRVLAPDHNDTVKSMTALAATLFQLGRRADAEQLQREALQVCRRSFGSDHPSTLFALSNLANMAMLRGDLTEAEALQTEALKGRQRTLGPVPLQTVQSVSNLALILIEEGRNHEAETLLQNTLARKAPGPKHPFTLVMEGNLGLALDHQKHFTEAEALFRETLTKHVDVFGWEHPNTLDIQRYLAITLRHLGRYAEAESVLKDSQAVCKRVLGPDNPATATATYELGVTELQSSNRNEALSLLAEALAHGLGPKERRAMTTDPELKLLHGDPRFEALLDKARQQPPALP